MRRNASIDSLASSFSEFGAIREVNVACGEKGFGFVRFRSHVSVERSLRRYVRDEILVDDVAVVCQVLGGGNDLTYTGGTMNVAAMKARDADPSPRTLLSPRTPDSESSNVLSDVERQHFSSLANVDKQVKSELAEESAKSARKSRTKNQDGLDWVRPTAVTVTRSKIIIKNSMSNDSSGQPERVETTEVPRSAPRMYHEKALQLDLSRSEDVGEREREGTKKEDEREGKKTKSAEHAVQGLQAFVEFGEAETLNKK